MLWVSPVVHSTSPFQWLLTAGLFVCWARLERPETTCHLPQSIQNISPDDAITLLTCTPWLLHPLSSFLSLTASNESWCENEASQPVFGISLTTILPYTQWFQPLAWWVYIINMTDICYHSNYIVSVTAILLLLFDNNAQSGRVAKNKG